MRALTPIIAVLALAWGCAAGSGSEWRRADGAPEADADRERRSRDVADCATRVGAPTPGTQSTMSPSRGEFQDCMRSKGWERVP